MNRWTASVLLMSLLLVACGADQSDSVFDADPAPISPDLVAALGEGEDPDQIPEVKRNFLEHCARGGQDTLPELPAVQRGGLVAVCGCTYTALVDYAFSTARDDVSGGRGLAPEQLAQAAFARFSGLDDSVLADEVMPDEVADILRVCIRSEAGI